MTKTRERRRRAQLDNRHRCPIPGCGNYRPEALLMCGPHWQLVPGSLKGEVWRAWAGGAGRGTTALRVAQHRAVMAVVAQEE